ncbi:DEAD/DEAH box helicase [Bacillaceae bacterium S4-13-56]
MAQNANEFHNFRFSESVQKGINQLGFKKPTAIQLKVIPPILRGESVIGQSHTGSGKTHAYLLPMFQSLEEDKRVVQFVIIAPTRELAIQIYDEVKKFIDFAEKKGKWFSKLLIGGTEKKKDIEKLKEAPHIVVGTPTRVLDLAKEGVLDLYTAKSLVLDEADLAIDLGFLQEVDQILVRMNQDSQMMVFSATIPEKLAPLLKKYMDNPTLIKIKEQTIAPEKMEHRLIPLRHRKVGQVIEKVAELINPFLALIFVNRKDACDVLADDLISRGLNVGVIHGGLSPRERKRVLKEIKDLRYQYIVATDLAARGIDIPGVSHVINAELPQEEEVYIHRVGRTARAGLEGTALSLYKEDDSQLISKLEKKGLVFTAYDVNKGEWQPIKKWNERATRVKQESEIEKQAWSKVKKPTKVKPGYKKKMKTQAKQIQKKLERNSFKKKK